MTKKRLLTAAILVSLLPPLATGARAGAFQSAAPAVAQAEAEWRRHTYPGEEFSAMLPAAPFVWDIHRILPGTMWATEKGRVFGAYADGVVYLITSYDKPRASETLEYFYNEFSGRPPMAGKETAERDVVLDSFPGREFSFKYTSTNLQDPAAKFPVGGTIRVYLTKKHAYVIEAFGEGEGQLSIRKFLDSFTLSSKPGGELIAATPVTESPLVIPPPPDASQPLPAAAVANGDSPKLQKEVASKAILVFKPEPGFTEEARKNNVTGVVRVKLVLGANGKVSGVFVVKWLPDGLTERAIRAARHILFVPARKDGRRVSQWITIEYTFNIY